MVERYILITLAIAIGVWIWFRINRRLFADLFSPWSILLIGWALPLSLRAYRLSIYEVDWGIRTQFALGWVTLVLVVSSLAPAVFVRPGDFGRRRHIFEQAGGQITRPSFLLVLLGAWLVAFGVFLYSEFITNPIGIPLLGFFRGEKLSVSAYHRWGKDTRWAVISPLLFVLSPMLYMAGRFHRGRWIRRILLPIALLYPVFGLLKLSRSDVFIGGLNIAFVEYLYRKYRHPRWQIGVGKGLVLSVLFVAILYGTLAIREAGSFGINVYAHHMGLKYADGPWIMEVVAQIYGYAAIPFENFNRFLNSYQGGMALGISFLRPLLSILMLGDIADAKIASIDFNVVGQGAGSQTFLSMLYAELGWLGLIVVPLIYGVLYNYLYVKARLQPSIVNLFVYLSFVFPWSYLYFGNAFSVLTFYLNAAVVIFLVILQMVIDRPERTPTTAVNESRP